MSSPTLLRTGGRAISVLTRNHAICRVDVVPRRSIVDLSYSTHFMDFKGSSIPSSMKKLLVTKLSHNFREAVSLQTVPVPTPGDTELLVRNRFVGINASDINYSAGRYDPSVKPPFGAGFEGVGEVVGLGLSASARHTVGETVAYFVDGGAFAEYVLVPSGKCMAVPAGRPEPLCLPVSAATAHIALATLGELAPGQTVLVTAAAGGTGQFAVQLAKRAGCRVLGTCSSTEKAGFLKSLGCDRPVDYTREDLRAALRSECPRGVDVVYESVGGALFDLAVDALAERGRLIVIGFVSGYGTPSGLAPLHGGGGATLPVKLLRKSASVRGFFLPHFRGEYRAAVADLLQMWARGELVCEVDRGDLSPGGRFLGLESVFRAVDHMYAGKNLGKVVVELPPAAPPAVGSSKL